MDRSFYRVALCRVALLGAMVVMFAATAWTQPVDFLLETHFRCYITSQQTPQPATTVTLDDQFLKAEKTIDEPLLFCPPVSKAGLPILLPEEHLTAYLAENPLVPHMTIQTQDQFGERTLMAVNARYLLVPTQKRTVDGVATALPFPEELNHSWCYDVVGEPIARDVTLRDQFGTDTVRVEHPRLFCNPVTKRIAGQPPTIPPERNVHLTCYDIFGPQRTTAVHAGVRNQFEEDTFMITAFQLLCVPAAKHKATAVQ